ncbi:MAG: HlyD family secretion protein [Marinifilaceae bacterium]
MDEMNTTAPAAKGGKRKIILFIIFICAAIALAVIWWLNYRKYISTDDANVASYRVAIAPQIGGMIDSLYVQEGMTVKCGDTLFTLDRELISRRLAENVMQREQQHTQLSALGVKLETMKKQVSIASIRLNLAQENYNRARTRYQQGAISLEQFQNVEEQWKIAVVEKDIAQLNVKSLDADIATTLSEIGVTEALILTTQAQQNYYTITAPCNGIIGKRWQLPGDVVEMGQTVFTLNEDKPLWISVFLEETKFENIHNGQETKILIDAYPHLEFYGKIFYIGDNAASEFALVPANNASGNFTKVTQRIQLKVSIDSVAGKNKYKQDVKLVSGMSATVKIIKNSN